MFDAPHDYISQPMHDYSIKPKRPLPPPPEQKVIGTMRHEDCAGCGFTLLAIEDTNCPRCNRPLKRKARQ